MTFRKSPKEDVCFLLNRFFPLKKANGIGSGESSMFESDIPACLCVCACVCVCVRACVRECV